MQIALTRESDRKIRVEVFDDEDGKSLLQKIVDRYSERDQQWLASLTQWSKPDAIEKLNEASRVEDGEPITELIEVDSRTLEKHSLTSTSGESQETLFTVTCRELHSPRTAAVSYQDVLPQDALRACFENAEGVEPIIEWTDSNRLTCLDIDYHDMLVEDRPKYPELSKIVRKVLPQPYCWHPSHAGGAKLYYLGAPGFGADELASIAGLSWSTLDSRATFDVLTSSRHPGFDRIKDGAPSPCNENVSIEYIYGQADTSSVRRLLHNELAPDEVEELLNERGWKLGSTLPHTECLISPDTRDRLSVYVGDTGIYCHSCASRGLGYNSRPGHYPYAALVRKTDSRLGNMVKHFCHYEHAKIVLGNLYKKLNEKCLEHVYRSLLKVYHTCDDPRIPLVFSAGRGFVRVSGQWVTADGQANVAKQLDSLVKSLPATLVPDKDGKFRTNIPRLVAYSNTGDLSEIGYPDITFLRGCRIYGEKLEPKSEENVKIIVSREFRHCPPKYLPKHTRMDESEAWDLVEEIFPGIDRNYLKLIIAAKGASEGRLAQCPYLLVTGVSGSGKSTTAQIAAGICGEKAQEVVFTSNIERYRMAMMDSAKQSGIVVVNEIFKDAKANRLSPLQALNPMLTITEESRSHVLYTGSVPFGRLPVFILTDIECPIEVTQDVQIARRFTYYRLNRRMRWDETLIKSNLRPHEFRTLSSSHTLASDTILSTVIDDFFSTRMSLQEIAEQLTADTYESEGVEEREILHLDMKDFYNAVCKAPDTVGSDAHRYPTVKDGKYLGWKLITRSGSDTPELTAMWNQLCDDATDQNEWFSSRQISQVDWSSIIGVDFPVRCRYTPYIGGKRIYVRFESAEKEVAAKRHQPRWINGRRTDVI